MKSIYILDDHPIITEGIAQLLANNQQYQITTGHHYSELYNYLNDHTPDLLIIDYEIQDKTALDVITYLQKKGVNIPQLIYTMHTEFWIIKLLIKAEVAGIVTKNDKIEEIEKAIHNILHEGNKYYSPTALNVVLSIMGDHSTEKSIVYTPSPRENEIIQMLSCGLTSDEIAHKLNLSKNTIDTMRKNILYNPQIQISAESETKRSIFREKDKTKRSKKESAQHSKSRNKSFVMTSVSAL